MKILAIDSSSEILSICVSEDNVLMGEYTIRNLHTHSPKIVPMIDELLKNLDITLDNIDVYGISIGPGSFTGLRIGLALVKGFAQAKNKPVVGVSTLLSLAKNVTPGKFLICPMIDAKNDNIYTGLLDETFNIVMDYDCLNIDELIQKCNKQKLPILFIGNGAIIHKEKILKEVKEKKIYNIQDSDLSARNIALVTYDKYVSGELDNAITLSPMYLRQTQAERESKSNG